MKKTQTSPTRIIIDQAWPIFVAQIAAIAGTTIDTAMAGRLSATDLAGVALGANIYLSVFATFMGAVAAIGPIAAHHFGAGRMHEIGHDVAQAFWTALLFSLIGIPLLLWTAPWFALAQAPPEVTRIASGYLAAQAVALTPLLATRVLVGLNSAVSRPRITMGINLAALLFKVPLNLVFIHGAGPIPGSGGVGCGIASAVLAWIVFAMSYAVWRADPYFKRFRTQASFRWHGPVWRSQRELLALGLPIGLATLFEISSFTFMGILIARLGAAVLGAHQIVANVVSVLFMMPLSIGFAASALVAQRLGARRPAEARAIAHRAIALTVALACVFAATVWLARKPIATVYTQDAQVAAIAIKLLAIAAWYHLADALQCTSFQVLRGYKIATLPMLIYGSCLWGIGIAGGFWIAYSDSPFGAPLGATGFWLASGAGLGIAAILLFAHVRFVARAAIEPDGPATSESRSG